MPDQTVVLTAGTGISTSGTYPNFTITNTAPSSGGTVTSVTGTAPVVSSGGTTPAISMAAATGSVNGYLTSTDWTTFNNKSNTNGTVTSVAALTLGTTGTDLSSTVANGTTTPVITLNVPTASAANRGALSAADWATFNGKVSSQWTTSGSDIYYTTGNVFVNTTSLPTGVGAAKVVVAGEVSTNCISQQAPSSSGNYFFQDFVCGTTEVGYIRSSNGTTLNYTSISDYRLKTNVQPMTKALETISKLNPCTYNWVKDNSEGQGFIAHELQAVVPDCVTGEKDAVDAEGKPQYQGVDTSFLVATLTAAIQELNTKFDAYVASHP